MQPPTCSGIRVRSVADCNLIFHAVSLGLLPLVSRRLSIDERREIHSGCVFVWEERSSTIEAVGDGLERWTDSRRWGASRLAKDFLLYQEKLPDVNDPHLRAAMHHNRLVKQTYSVYVDKPDGRRKWHLVAYSSPEIGHHLPTVDDIPALAALRHQVPEGAYQAARYSKTRTRQDAETEEQQQPQQQRRLSPRRAVRAAGPSPSSSPDGFSAASGSGSGKSANNSPEIGLPYTQARRTPPPTSVSHSNITAPAPPLASSSASPPSPPPVTMLANEVASLSMASSLPRIPPPPPSRPDPEWVLRNYVAVAPNIHRMPRRRLLDELSSKDMAPLVYMRPNPYRQRHPLDNDALRALEVWR